MASSTYGGHRSIDLMVAVKWAAWPFGNSQWVPEEDMDNVWTRVNRPVQRADEKQRVQDRPEKSLMTLPVQKSKLTRGDVGTGINPPIIYLESRLKYSENPQKRDREMAVTSGKVCANSS